MLERNRTIDIARGLGIILVVLGHSWIVMQENRLLFKIIYSFHVPLFFFLAGLFLKENKTFGDFFREKVDSVLKPYAVVLLLFWFLRPPPKSAPLLEYLAGMLYASGATIQLVPLWFLPCLFVSLLMTWLALFLTRRRPAARYWRVIAALGFLCVGYILIKPFGELHSNYLQYEAGDSAGKPLGAPFSLDLACLSASFMLLGYLLNQQVKRFTYNGVLFSCALVAFVLLHAYSGAMTDLNMRVYGNILISTLEALLGILIVICVSAWLRRFSTVTELLSYIGVGTLFILLFHAPIQAQVFNLIFRLSGNHYFSALCGLAAGLIVPLGLLELTRRSSVLSMLLLPRKKPIVTIEPAR